MGEFAGLKACLAASIAPMMDALGERATPNIAASALMVVAESFAQDAADFAVERVQSEDEDEVVRASEKPPAPEVSGRGAFVSLA